MATRRIMLVVLTAMVTIAFGAFGQKAFGAEANAPAEKKVEKNHKAEHGMTGEHVRMRMAELNRQLNLTEEQKKTVQPIIENEVKEMQALKADASLSKEQKAEKMKTIRQTTQEEIKKVITPEQQAKLGEAKEGKKAEMKEGIKGEHLTHAQKRMMELNEKLGLSDEQKTKIQPIIEKEMKEIAAAAKGDNPWAGDQEQEKIRKIQKRTNEEIKKELTPEQQAKFDAMKEKGHEKKAEQKGQGQQK